MFCILLLPCCDHDDVDGCNFESKEWAKKFMPPSSTPERIKLIQNISAKNDAVMCLLIFKYVRETLAIKT